MTIARFRTTIPGEAGEIMLTYDIPLPVWCQLFDHCVQARDETGGMLTGRMLGDGHAMLTGITLFDELEENTPGSILLPDGWDDNLPADFQGTWHTHPEPSPPSIQDINHLLCLMHDGFWPIMLVLCRRKQLFRRAICEPGCYIGVSAPGTPLVYELHFDGIYPEAEE
jgi:hypothetical protein